MTDRVDANAREHIEELVRYAYGAGRAARGSSPIDMSPMAYVAGALFALERVGAISASERQAAIVRCHDAFGLKRPAEWAQATPGDAADVTAVAYRPEWTDVPPPPSPPRPGRG